MWGVSFSEVQEVLQTNSNPISKLSQIYSTIKIVSFCGAAVCGLALSIATFAGLIINNQALLSVGGILFVTNTFAAYDAKQLTMLPSLVNSVNRLTLRVKDLFAEQKKMKSNTKSLEKVNSELKESIKTTKKTIDTKSNQLEEKIRELDQVTERLKKAEKKVISLEQICKDLRETEINLSEENKKQNELNPILKEENEKLSHELNQYNSENDELKENIQTLHGENLERANSTEHLTAIIANLKIQLKLQQEANEQDKKENIELKARIQELSKSSVQVLNSTERLSEIQKREEGRAEALQAILGKLEQLHKLNSLVPILKSIKKDGNIDPLIEALHAENK